MNSVPETYVGEMRVDIPGTVRVAQARSYSAAQLAQCFFRMSEETAQLLLDGTYVIDADGHIEVANEYP